MYLPSLREYITNLRRLARKNHYWSEDCVSESTSTCAALPNCNMDSKPKRTRRSMRSAPRRIDRRLACWLQTDFLTHLFTDRLLNQRLQRVARFGVDERVLHDVPIQLVALVIRTHPNLPHRRVRADHELRGRIFELHAEGAGVEIHF